jgi:hypothetical protein
VTTNSQHQSRTMTALTIVRVLLAAAAAAFDNPEGVQ